MIDFASEEGFKYLVLDANWYGPEFASASNPTEGDKAKEVQKLIAYGKSKGVGIWLYLNDVGGRKYPIEKTLKQYADWGAAGVKYGFMDNILKDKSLLCCWDFSGSKPFISKGRYEYSLIPGNTPVEVKDEGPLTGRSIDIKEGQYLYISRDKCPGLNLHDVQQCHMRVNQ